MPTSRLTQRRVDALKPHRRACDIRDAEIKGFGVRILPSGRKRYFLHSQIDGNRVWHAIGDADDITLECARTQARALLVSRRNGGEPASEASEPVAFEMVAEEVFPALPSAMETEHTEGQSRVLQESDLALVQGQANCRHHAPGHSAVVRLASCNTGGRGPLGTVLSVILKQAEVYGYRPEDSNPCTGIKRYRRLGRERFLTAGEIRRLSRVLERYRESHPLQSSIVRLLLLTGCRKSEILTLRWSDYREEKLLLSDSKTGPRTVWLSSVSRRILNGLPRSGPWVFPSPRRNFHLSGFTLDSFWWKVRAEAGIEDVRCHDLRHTYASVALAHGETILTIGRLLGHNDPATTLKYTHLADAAVHEAAEALVPVLGGED